MNPTLLMNGSVADDPRLTQALEAYISAMESGVAIDRETFLAEHADIRDDLAACLDGLEFVHRLAPQFQQSQDGARSTPPPQDSGALPLGDYRILREVGRGGMGVVYEAEQLSLSRRVALKVLPLAAVLDPRHLQRFKNEALAAAQLDHPHIVPVYGVGSDRGVHYYAMKFIQGITLAHVIDHLRRGTRNRAAAAMPDPFAPTLLPRQAATETSQQPHSTMRLAAFSTEINTDRKAFFRSVAAFGRDVALALDYAHERGIVHRDIKPSNLMLDEAGAAWVTDFGLAHIDGDAALTMSGDLLGTLRYMSPEQLLAKRAVLDHRTDIYSLGVTLYEFLTLQPAYPQSAREDIIRGISFEDPPSVRKLQRDIPDDLEVILLKATAKNPAARYDTAEDLAADLQRFLDHQPIRARRPTLAQRAAKWSRRHPALVYSSLAILLVTTITLLISSFLILDAKRRTENHARQAQTNLKKAREAVNQMLLRVSGQLASIPKMEPVRRELLTDALNFYATFLEGDSTDPALRHERSLVYIECGKVHRMLGDFDAAEKSYVSAIGILKELLEGSRSNPDYREALSHAYNAYGILLNADSDRFDDSEQALEQALEISRELVAEFPSRYRASLANQLNSKGCLLWRQGLLIEAEKSHREALALSQELPNADESEELSASLFNLAHVLNDRGRVDEAEAMYRQELAIVKQIAENAPDDPHKWLRLSESQSNFAVCLDKEGTRAESEQLLRDCIAIRKGLAESFPNVPHYRYSLSVAHLNFATSVANSGRFNEAEQSYRASLPIIEQLVAEFPNVPMYREMIGHAHNNLGDVALRQDRIDDAVRAFQKATLTFSVLVHQIPDQPNLRSLHSNATIGYGLSMLERDKTAAAQSIIRRGLAIAEELVSNFSDSSDYRETLGSAYGAMGMVEYRLGNWSEAARWFEKTFEIVSETPDDGEMLFYVAMTHWQLGEHEQADKSYLAATEWMQSRSYTTHPRLLRLRAETEQLLGGLGDQPADAAEAIGSKF